MNLKGFRLWFDHRLMAKCLEFPPSSLIRSGRFRNPESTQDSKDEPDLDILRIMALLKWIDSRFQGRTAFQYPEHMALLKWITSFSLDSSQLVGLRLARSPCYKQIMAGI